MPSTLHEALTQMFRHRPSLATELLSGPLGMDLPAHQQVRLDPCELNDLTPTEYRADAVVTLTAADNPVLAVVVEAQLRQDKGKRWSWPVYLTTLRARLRCPTVLLVLCANKATADWCGAPIDLGHPGWTLRPLVLGPDLVPVVTDTEQASRVPELAILSLLAHGATQDPEKVLHALAAALAGLEEEDATLYSEVVFATLPQSVRARMEALMATVYRQYKVDFVRRYVEQGRAEGEAKGRAEGEARGRAEGEAWGEARGRAEGEAKGWAEGEARGRAEGEAQGKAEALFTVLAARGIEVPDSAQACIDMCVDIERLEEWVGRAVTASSIDDVFG